LEGVFVYFFEFGLRARALKNKLNLNFPRA
jgi:hypothetical protein